MIKCNRVHLICMEDRMAATVKEVAKHAGVSTATVSRVINNDAKISVETREKVLESIEVLGYKINNIARSLKTSKTYTIGFICPELANTFFMNIAEGIEKELIKHGYSFIICSSGESKIKEEQRIKLLVEKRVDGIIIIPASNEESYYSWLKENEVPLVLVDRLVEDFSCDAVLSDNINGAYQAIEYLIKKGKRSIGFIGGDMRLTSAKERYEGYLRALSDYCISKNEDIIKFGDFHAESGYVCMKEIANSKNLPECIFVSNYFMHIGAARYVEENNELLKEKLTITGFDDMGFINDVFRNSVLFVQQPMSDIGEKAAQLLMSRINGEEIAYPQVIRLKTKLVDKE